MIMSEEGSFAAAALRIGLSKEVISLRITELERAAGGLPVRRTTGSVRQTEVGQVLVESMQGVFADIEHSFAKVCDLVAEPTDHCE
jgi:DNA-binding transcriptional LysR family regulator